MRTAAKITSHDRRSVITVPQPIGSRKAGGTSPVPMSVITSEIAQAHRRMNLAF
jgi:hypothetical protein